MPELNIDTQFSGFISARNLEVDIRWKKVQIFFLINSALLGFVTGVDIDFIFKVIGCVFGLAITGLWFVLQLEAQYAIDYWNTKISEIEVYSKINKKGFEFKYPHEGFRYKYFSTHYIVLFLVGIFTIGWLMFLIKLV